jgi:hypothetical protein
MVFQCIKVSRMKKRRKRSQISRCNLALLIVVCIILFNGCAHFHYSLHDLIGDYHRVRGDTVETSETLSLYNHNFLLLDSGKLHVGKEIYKPYFCCDTIAYGVWEIDNEHGVLSLSTPQFSDDDITSKVIESFKFSPDSVYFLISNPIEKRMGKKHENIFYTVEVYSSQNELGDNLSNKEFFTNSIIIPNLAQEKIEEISIHIYTAPEYDGRTISARLIKTATYKVTKRGNNFFEINIPALTYGYLSYLRFNQRLIKIINSNKLILDGVRYQK